MRLRVWWIPQIPMEVPFRVMVETEEEAHLLLDVLANYDSYQLEHNIKPDYCNIGGLEVSEDGEWTDWYNDDGEDFDEYRDRVLREKKEA